MLMNFSHDELEVIEMAEKKESIFSKLFKPSKSCCCCSVEIVDEDKDEAAQNKEEKEKESK